MQAGTTETLKHVTHYCTCLWYIYVLWQDTEMYIHMCYGMTLDHIQKYILAYTDAAISLELLYKHSAIHVFFMLWVVPIM